MKALVQDRVVSLERERAPLRRMELPVPVPDAAGVRIRVRACGVCHTEIDEIEGRTAPSRFPRVPGHQVVGVVDAVGAEVDASWMGARVGVAWIFSACGHCRWCLAGFENLCPQFVGTGRDVDGGYAEYMVAPAAFVHRLPDSLSDEHAAPLLCAGAIGLRALDACALTDGEPLGLTGFGASGHLVLTMARLRFPHSPVLVFARNPVERALARERGAAWTGEAGDDAPVPLAAIIDTTPVWTTVIRALEQLAPGGRLVINAIRKEQTDLAVLRDMDYARHLWREKSIRSVANITRADVRRCLDLAAAHDVRPEVTLFPLESANEALMALKRGIGRGARVLQI